ncbi:hypothetical protein DBR32_01840 [Taibaiella sp. KBW10]|uniref:hypothetical protein n=1 Tax=Taibaiella sp. KBW10 TaxID=2153357 RepID=UPI000F594868|nr:hypothetical protein [Taibaiella sp. KBW10]RQO32371.1 hypothetical protein DBR32_01840 [Taibaiella sp. KBW10]
MTTNNQPSTWSRLRWPIKALIIALPLVALLWIAQKSGWIDKLNEQTSTASSPSLPNADNDQKKGQTTETTTSGEHRSFNFSPVAPVNGTLKGVVEVGASGFNSFVINVDKDKNWEIKSKDFGQSFVYEGLASTEDIRLGLKKYIAAMAEKGVKSNNIHFIISSGAQKEPKTGPIADELKKMGYVVNLVTAEQEGKLALKSVLPKAYYDNAFVVDIGSGNTKISYPNASGLTSLEAPGAKYYEKDMTDAAVFQEVKTKAQSIPAAKRKVCFIIGGVPYELAKKTRQGEERYTVLNAPDTYKAGDSKKVSSGLNIYKALVDATGCDTFVFDWDANFSIGFILSL